LLLLLLLLPLLLLLRRQLVEELLTFWSLEDYEDTLEELEEALIVSSQHSSW
jgi:ABC-type sulfate transport system permease component